MPSLISYRQLLRSAAGGGGREWLTGRNDRFSSSCLSRLSRICRSEIAGERSDAIRSADRRNLRPQTVTSPWPNYPGIFSPFTFAPLKVTSHDTRTISAGKTTVSRLWLRCPSREEKTNICRTDLGRFPDWMFSPERLRTRIDNGRRREKFIRSPRRFARSEPRIQRDETSPRLNSEKKMIRLNLDRLV